MFFDFSYLPTNTPPYLLNVLFQAGIVTKLCLLSILLFGEFYLVNNCCQCAVPWSRPYPTGPEPWSSTRTRRKPTQTICSSVSGKIIFTNKHYINASVGRLRKQFQRKKSPLHGLNTTSLTIEG